MASHYLKKESTNNTLILDFLTLLWFRHFWKKNLPAYFFLEKAKFFLCPRFYAQVEKGAHGFVVKPLYTVKMFDQQTL